MSAYKIAKIIKPPLTESWFESALNWLMNKISGHEKDVEAIASGLQQKQQTGELRYTLLDIAEKLGMDEDDLNREVVQVDVANHTNFSDLVENDMNDMWLTKLIGNTVGGAVYILAAVIWVIGMGTFITASAAPILKVIVIALWSYLGYRVLVKK